MTTTPAPPSPENTAPVDGPPTAQTSEIAALTLRYNRLLEPALLVLLVTAMLTGPIVLIRTLTPDFPWGHLPALVFFVALEGVATTTWLMHPDRLILNKPVYRLAEFLLVLILARIITWIIYIPLSWEVVRGYLLDPLAFLDGAFLILSVVALFTWAEANRFAARLNALALSPAERDYLSRSAEDDLERRYEGAAQTTMADRSGIVTGLFVHWLNGGLILMISGALTTVNYAALNETSFSLRSLRGLGLQPEVLAALVFYFVAGLYLISSGRLQVMRVRWLLEKAETTPTIQRIWRRSSALILVVIALLAAFLPIGSTVPIAVIVDAAMEVIVTVATYVVAVIVLLITLLISLFGSRETTVGETAPLLEVQPTPPPPQMAESGAGLSEEARLALGAGFWFIVIVLVVIAVLFYLRERGFRFNSTLLRLLWADLRRGWLAVWGGLSRRAEAVGGAVRSRLRLRRDEDGSDAPLFRFIRVNGLPPRERIRYFYLSTVRRAGERGAARKEDETPLEYLDALRTRWPEAEEDLDLLTDAFVEARYNKQPISEEDVNPIKRTWRRVKAGLRRKPPPPPPPDAAPDP